LSYTRINATGHTLAEPLLRINPLRLHLALALG